MELKDFKIGNYYKWRIKTDLIAGRMYGSNTFMSDMVEFKGESFEATENQLEGRGLEYKGWDYTREMVEPFTETTEEPLKYGDMVRIHRHDQKVIASIPWAYVGLTADGRVVTAEQVGMGILGKKTFNAYQWVKNYICTKFIKKVEETEIIELTVAEIASKLGINIKDLKIIGEK